MPARTATAPYGPGGPAAREVRGRPAAGLRCGPGGGANTCDVTCRTALSHNIFRARPDTSAAHRCAHAVPAATRARRRRRGGTGSWWPFSGAGCACSNSRTGSHAARADRAAPLPGRYGNGHITRKTLTARIRAHTGRQIGNAPAPLDSAACTSEIRAAHAKRGATAATGRTHSSTRYRGRATFATRSSPVEAGGRPQPWRLTLLDSTTPRMVMPPQTIKVSDSGTEEPSKVPTSASAPIGSRPPATAVPKAMHRPAPV